VLGLLKYLVRRRRGQYRADLDGSVNGADFRRLLLRCTRVVFVPYA
jgi:hypothetical protein